MCQYDYAFMCLRTLFCLTNISAPWYHTELAFYLEFPYGSQFKGEKMPQSGVGSMQRSNKDCLPMEGHT